MLLHINSSKPDIEKIFMVRDCLSKGGIIIYPTDTIYGIGCDINNKTALERICQIKNVALKKANFSFICYDLSDLSKYAKAISTPLYRVLKSHLPGPYTFIMQASKETPALLQSKKHTIGIRVPDNLVARTIVKELGHPVISTSLPGTLVEEYSDPEIIFHHFKNRVDIIIDAGTGGIVPSTVIDCTNDEYQLIRQGAGAWNV